MTPANITHSRLTFVMDWTLHFERQAKDGFARPIQYDDHYKRQIGGGGFYAGVRQQKGYGLGGLLARLGRMVIPILKPIAKTLEKQVVKSGARFAEEVIDGESPREAFKRNASRGLEELTTPKGVKKKRKPRKRVISKKHSRRTDLYDDGSNS